MNIFPKTNGTVKVTYGNLTKTLQFSGINSQQVFFGTFNGVSDSVATPASGTLSIEGAYSNFSIGTYKTYSNDKQKTNYCSCITDVSEWGSITSIENNAFYNCSKLALTSLPSGITSISDYAFYGCTNLALTSLPSGITSIGNNTFNGCSGLISINIPEAVTSIGSAAFQNCSSLMSINIPKAVTSIGINAFYGCSGLTSVTFNTFSWYVTMTAGGSSGVKVNVTDAENNVTLITSTYRQYNWYRS